MHLEHSLISRIGIMLPLRKYNMFQLLLFLSILGSFVTTASGQERKLIPLVGFASFCNVPIYEAKNKNIASVIRYRGQYVIIIDLDVRTDERWLKFVVAHECGHVNKRHLQRENTIKRRTISGFAKKMELEADCWAARYAPRIAVEYAFFYFRDHNIKSHPSYPTGEERAKNLRECAHF